MLHNHISYLVRLQFNTDYIIAVEKEMLTVPTKDMIRKIHH